MPGLRLANRGLALGDNYQQINVEAALADESSVFYTYQKLIALRKQKPF